MDDSAGRRAEHVALLIVAGDWRSVAGLMFFVVRHALS
jgi:hypothetical protein